MTTLAGCWRVGQAPPAVAGRDERPAGLRARLQGSPGARAWLVRPTALDSQPLCAYTYVI